MATCRRHYRLRVTLRNMIILMTRLLSLLSVPNELKQFNSPIADCTDSSRTIPSKGNKQRQSDVRQSKVKGTHFNVTVSQSISMEIKKDCG